MNTEVLNVLLPFDIMEIASRSKGVLFSNLINDSILLKKYEGIDNLVANIHKLMALNLVNVEKTNDPLEGDDYVIMLNYWGRSMFDSCTQKNFR